jgi:cell division inhibitor SepF
MNVLSKTLVYLGLKGEESDGFVRQEPVRQQAAASNKVTVLRTRRSSVEGNEIYTVEPSSYEEARLVADHYRQDISVIVNMANMSEVDCRKMLDFMLGLKAGREGHIKRVTSKVFLLTPASVVVNDDADEMLSEDDLLIQP